jgi:ubiquinone/menaquinone biosynthesis C-methylase UbiE
LRDIEQIPYVDFISLVRETNRPPGGKRTVRRWIEVARIHEGTRVLEIGANTGFTSLQIARVARCRVVGIDVNPSAVHEAQRLLENDVSWVRRLVTFRAADARELSFPDNAFDVIVCGGALSFIVERGDALKEIVRVLRPWGFICVSPLFYHTLPPDSLMEQLSDALGFPVPRWGIQNWEQFFLEAKLELYHKQEIRLESQSKEKVEAFARMLSEKDHLPDDPSIRDAIYQRALHFFSLFNENHHYLSFLLAILRKPYILEEMELFEVPWDTPI